MMVRSSERRSSLVWLAPILALVGVVVLARVLVGEAYASRIYPGVRVAGVDLGGQTIEQATAALQSRFELANVPISIQAADVNLNLTPSDLGARPRAQALAVAAYEAGRSGTFSDAAFGPILASRDSPPLATDALVDDGALTAAVANLANQVDRAPRDAQLRFSPDVALQPAVTGRTLDQPRAEAAVRAYLESHVLQPSAEPLVLDVATTNPAVTDAQLAPLRDQATQLLRSGIVVQDGAQSYPIDGATLRGALVVTGTPLRLGVQTSAMSDALDAVEKGVDRPARDARIVIADGHALVDEDQPGRALDRAATLAALDAKIGSGENAVPVVVSTVAPTVTAADLQPVAAEAQTRLDRGLVLTAEGQPFTIAAKQLGDLMVVQARGSKGSEVVLDPAKVSALVGQINDKFKRPSPDARFSWDNGKVSLLGPVVPGRALDQKKATQVILETWQAGKVDLPVIDTTIKVDDAFLARLNGDLKGIIADRSISYAGSIPERAHNIALALSKINGTVIMPGQTFSFNQAVGPTTLAAGFQWGFGYSTGSGGQSEVVPSVAGGICEVATSVFQPVFWTGYEIDERHWHMFPMHTYADQGYVGLDATVAPEDGVDLKWMNDTDHAVLIRSWGDGEATHVQLISTKPNWTVKVSPETISNVIPAPSQPIRTTSPLFGRGREIVLEVAQDGLTSHVTRNVVYPDGHTRTLNLTSDYQPSPLSILVGTG